MLFTNYFIDTLRGFPPDKVLLHAGGQSITAWSLFNSSAGLAQSLQKKGVKRGDRVLIVVKPGVEFLRIMYANMMIRTIVSIIDPEMGREHYRAKLAQFKPQHAFVDSRLVLLSEHPVARFIVKKLLSSVPEIPILKQCQVFTTGPRMPVVQKHIHLKRQSIIFHTEELLLSDAQEDFLVTYTSGTLAEPKGVVHSYASLSSSIRYLWDLLKLNGDEAIATHLPHFALLGINAGVKVYLWDNNITAEKKLKFIESNNISTLFGPPCDFLSMMEVLNSRKESFPPCLQSIYLGSAPVYTGFLKNLLACSSHVKVTCLYGMTENLMVAHLDARQKVSETPEGDLVGKLFPNIKLVIADDGEIMVDSDQLFNRYWQLKESTRPHRTGDLGTIDDQGRLILQGRKKDMIIRGNFNVYPGLYEPTINKIDGITEAVLIGRYNEKKADEEIVLVIESERKLHGNAINAKLRNGVFSIDREALPDRIVFMKLPRSGRQSKVNRQRLKQLVEQDPI